MRAGRKKKNIIYLTDTVLFVFTHAHKKKKKNHEPHIFIIFRGVYRLWIFSVLTFEECTDTYTG